MDMTGAAMTVARKPETGRHYLSDRCPVASDGRGREKEGKREGVVAVYELAETTPFLALKRQVQIDPTQAATTAHARAIRPDRSRIPALQADPRQKEIYS